MTWNVGVFFKKPVRAKQPSRRQQSRQPIAVRTVEQASTNLLINPDAVLVKVENGVATLTGAVPTPAARQAAYEAAAYTSGVVEVRNELQVAEPPA